MDTADGIGAGPSKRIEAMKDSRVGAIGVQSLVIVLILQIAAIIKLGFYAPFAFPLASFWGRLSQIFAIENYEYISNKESKSMHHEHWNGLSKEITPSVILIFMGIMLFLYFNDLNMSNSFLLICCIFAGLMSSVSIPGLINRYLGGHNGDSFGASLVITETTNLLLLSIILIPN